MLIAGIILQMSMKEYFLVKGENMYVCQKKVAVLMATYNGEKYIKEQIDSLLCQTFEDYCIYIHDDGSDDNTLKIVREYEKNNTERIVIMQGESTGEAKRNFLFMLKNVTADIYMFCDQDDVWKTDKIEKAVKEINKTIGKKPVLVYTDLEYVDKNLNVIEKSYFSYQEKDITKNSVKDVLIKNLFVGCTLAFNKQLRDVAINYKNIDYLQMHDWWIGLLACAMGNVIFINEQTIKYRQHDNNVTGSKNQGRIIKILKRWINVRNGIRIKRNYMKQRILFAKELFSVMHGDEKEYDFIRELSQLENKNKVTRIKFYLHNKMMEKNKSILWQMLWI